MTLEARLRRLPAAPATFEASAGVVVVGTGAAGISAALEAAASGADVLVVSKGAVGGGSTPWAQGGLAAVLGADDSAALHAGDTAAAGAGLCETAAVDALVAAAPGEIGRLERLGARFDEGPLGLEGGHSRRRIVHAGGDASGAEVHRVLSGALAAAVDAGRVRLWEGTVALDLLRDDAGATAGLLVGRGAGRLAPLVVGRVTAEAVVLATGGFGHAYPTTTNPAGVTGDGLALAVRAGALVVDVEFVQFHPTVLWGPGGSGRRPLVTEALRGAGATIVDHLGRPVMAGAHPLGDLAPRDVVAASMQRRMARGDGPGTHLWLDATGVGRARLERDFPTVVAACRAAGVDPASEAIPVAPGAHYACGGVATDLDGATSVEGLYAAGEVAGTGLHGANRLASNSLTEALAAGRRLGGHLAAEHRGRAAPPAASDPDPAGGGAGVDPAARPALAGAMARHAGVVRHAEGLEHLLALLASAQPAPPTDGSGGRPALDLETVEATNLHTVSTLVAVAAAARTESRGCHRRNDFPRSEPSWQRHLALRAAGGGVAVAADVRA